MRLKLDENLPAELVEHLAAMGHDADTVIDEGLSGSFDDRLLIAARRARRVLFTLDKGIGDVRRHPPAGHGGVVLFRLQRQGPRSVFGAVQRALPEVLSLAGPRRLVVVTETAIRSRR